MEGKRLNASYIKMPTLCIKIGFPDIWYYEL